MDILLLNQTWFKQELEQFGHRVISAGTAEHHDVPITKPFLHFDQLRESFPDGFDPERIVVHDNSSPILLEGLPEQDIPMLFYSIDVHHHFEFHKWLGNVFDHCYVAQPDYLPVFHEAGCSNCEWLPLWASETPDIDVLGVEREHDAMFVGSLKPDLNPDRVAFFEQLQQEVDILVRSGTWWQLFPTAKIVVNQSVKGDLNFRVFEAMICGVVMLTEKATNGLFELFTEGENVVSYEKGNVKDCADKIRWLLDNPQRLKQIAEAGRTEVLAKHLPIHRAEVLDSKLRTLERTKSSRRYFSWMTNLNTLSMRLEKLESSHFQHSLVYTLKAAETAVQQGEELDDSLASHLIHACIRFDIHCRSDAGAELLKLALRTYPNLPSLQLSNVRTMLNNGQVQEATQLAEQLLPGRVPELFQHAESMVANLLAGK